MRTSRSTRGSTLILVLLLIVVVSISAAAGYARTGAERRTNSSQRAQAAAFAVAQGGVEQYLASTTSLPSTFPATTSYTLPGGTAAVTLYRVRQDALVPDNTVYALRSVGTNTTGARADASTATAERAIVQLIRRQTASMDVDAAFVSLSGLNKNGTSGEVNGIDECTSNVIPGLAVPNGSYTPGSGSPSANNYIDGNPDNSPDYIGTKVPGSNAAGTANAEVEIDWESILAGTLLTPDFNINRSVSPATGSFPSSYANWPVVRVTGNLTNGDNFSGQGVLIVTGNADFSNITWNGIVLVGGQVALSGSATRVRGTIITGLNMKISPLSDYPFLPQTYPSESAVGNGNFLVRYNSCNIAQALNRLGGWQRIANAWADNWPTY